MPNTNNGAHVVDGIGGAALDATLSAAAPVDAAPVDAAPEPEIEHALLAAVFADPSIYARLLPWFDPQDCVVPQCRIVATAMAEVVASGGIPDVVSVYDHLVATGRAEQVGGWAFLSRLIQSVTSPAYGELYARLVQQRAWRRSIADLGRQMVVWADDPSMHAPDLLARVDAAVQRTRRAPAAPPPALDTIVDQALDGLLNPTPTHLLPTGIAALDARIGGMRPGDMVILAARPGVGKSALAATIALNVARAGGPVMLFSLEMSAALVVQRMLAALSGVDLTRMPRTPRDREALVAAAADLRALPIIIDDTPARRVADLRACVLGAPAGRPALVIVDYLQLLTVDPALATDRNRVQEVTAISRALTDLARTSEIPVLALSQLSRDSEKRQDPTPRLSDLRDSGALEQDAGLVLFLHPTAPRTPGGTVPVDVIIGKHRHGATGVVSLHFVPSCLRFVDQSPRLPDRPLSAARQGAGDRQAGSR